MKINIGSKNQVKVDALREILEDYPHLKDAEVVPVEVESRVDTQPKSLDSSVEGAMNRARDAFKNCDYSFGIESGLMVVPGTKSGFMDVCVCAIFDGKEFHLGLSSAWDIPKIVSEYVTKEGMDLTEAALKAGFTKNEKLGSAEGLIGIMTKGRLDRKEYTKEAIRTALIHIDKD